MSLQPWQAPVPIIGAGGKASPEWLRWLQQLLANAASTDTNAASIATLQSLVATLQAAVNALEGEIGAPLVLETNYARNGSQTLLDLVAGANIVLSDNGAGDITISSTGGRGTALTLETNGTANGSQTLLNLVAGANITLIDDGAGNITIAITSPYPPTPILDSATTVPICDASGNWIYAG